MVNSIMRAPNSPVSGSRDLASSDAGLVPIIRKVTGAYDEIALH